MQKNKSTDDFIYQIRYNVLEVVHNTEADKGHSKKINYVVITT